MLNKEQELKTNVVLALACLVFYVIFHLKGFLLAAVLILLITTIGGIVSRIIANGWMKFANALGFVTNKIILTVVYYLMLFPLALLYRVFNKTIYRHFFYKKEGSYYKERNFKYTPESMENQW